MFGLGAGEIFLIFLIALFFLGPKKLPELAKGLGSAMREFNKARDQVMAEIHRPADEIKNELKEELKTDEVPKLEAERVAHHDEEEIVTKRTDKQV